MKPEIKAKWVQALTSGEYTQTKGNLQDGKGFCCLGVLCDLHSQETATGWDHSKYPELNLAALNYSGQKYRLPDEVMVWAGLEDEPYGSIVTINGVTDSLSDHNDAGSPFSEIAKAIESQL